MSDGSDPSTHQKLEEQFVAHVWQLLRDERLRIQTTRGRRAVTAFQLNVHSADRAEELHRTMQMLGKPDYALKARMPVGKMLNVNLSRRRFLFFNTWVGSMHIVCLSPTESLILGNNPPPTSVSEMMQALAKIPSDSVPTTVVLMSSCGFSPEAMQWAKTGRDRPVIVVSPNSAGGWTVAGPEETSAINELFDPEADNAKRQRIKEEIEGSRVDLLSSGLASDKLAARLNLPQQFVESELKSYAKANPGLAARRLDGRVVVFQESSSAAAPAGGLNMPFIDKMKSLFSLKGEVEKKIALLSERRAALSQQRDRSYEDMGALETREAEMRKQFQATTGDLARRRITSQLLQIRKDLERRQQLLSMLNQQINIVGTHLLNLELQQQGKSAKLPTGDEIAADAAAAEEVLAELEANSELADSVGSASQSSLTHEEQALYDELMQQTPAKSEAAAPATPVQTPAKDKPVTTASPSVTPPPPLPQRKRSEPEAG